MASNKIQVVIPTEDCTVLKQCHFLPCKINYNGEALIEKYFTTSVREQPESILTSTFRGRPLQGMSVELPDGFQGALLKEDNRPCTDAIERVFKVSSRFDRFTYWNLDKEPSVNDQIQKLFKWTDIAQAIHAPVKSKPE